MDLRKYNFNKKNIRHKKGGFTVMIIPDQEGETLKIVVTPAKIYFAILSLLAVVVFSVTCSYFFSHVSYRANNSSTLSTSNFVMASYIQEAQMLEDELSKTQAELNALKEYVVSLGTLENEVKQTLKLNGTTVTLDSILSKYSSKPQLQAYTEAPKTLSIVKSEIVDISNAAIEAEETLQKLQTVAYTFNLLKAETPDYWPVQGTITSSFGWRQNPFGGDLEFHTGIDIAVDYGSPIRAAGKGKVVYAQWSSDGYGNMVIISHRDGIESVYAHLSLINVKVGDSVEKGQVIGYEGYNGSSTGPHLHFEIRENDTCVNPLLYLQ